jgi:hypothetical protein
MATPLLRWAGSWRTRRAVVVLLGAVLLGVIGTVVIRRDPGFLIGLLIIVGSVVAAIGTRRAVHRLIPLPALSYLVATFAAGYLHDKSNLNTSKEFYTSFLSWIGSAFFAVVWATVLIVVIAFGRWVMSKRLVSGTLTATTSAATTSAAMRPAAGSASAGLPAPGQPGRDSRHPWGQRDSRGGRAPRGDARDAFNDRAPGGNAFGDPRGDRGRRGDSDALDDPSRQGDAAWPGGNRGPHGGRDGNASDPWGGQRDSSWDQRPARDPRDRQVRRDDRASHDGRVPRDRQPQRRDGDSRFSDRSRDNRHPHPADGPQDLW